MKKFTFSPKTIFAFVTLLMGMFFISLFTNWYSTPFQKDFADWVGKIHPALGKNPFWVALALAVFFVSYTVYYSFFRKEAAEATESNAPKATTQFSLEDRKELLKILKESYQNRLKSKLTHEWHSENNLINLPEQERPLQRVNLKLTYTNKGVPDEIIRDGFNLPQYHSEGKALKALDKVFIKQDGSRRHFHERIMILGNAGVGKTVQLLDLACKLIENAEKNAQEPIPVIINAVSWRSKNAEGKLNTIEDWLLEVLPDTIGASKAVAEGLLAKHLLLLFDGLDEIGAVLNPTEKEEAFAIAEQKAFIAALRQFTAHQERFVLTGRTAEFERLNNAEAFVYATIEVQELTSVTLKKELEILQKIPKMRDVATNLLRATEQDTLLQKVLCNSFYLNLALSLFHAQHEKLPTFGTEAEYETYLKKLYVAQKLAKTETPEKAQKWLTWLAKMLNNERKRTFQLAYLQPRQLQKSWWYRLVGVLVGVLVVGLLFGLLVSLAISVPDIEKWFFETFTSDWRNNLVVGLFVGLVGVWSIGLLGGSVIHVSDVRKWSLETFKSNWKNNLFAGLVIGMVVGLIAGLVVGMVFGLVVGLVVGLIAGLVVGMVVGLVEPGTTKWYFIKLSQPYQRFRSSMRWDIIQYGLLISIGSGLIILFHFQDVQSLWKSAVLGISLGFLNSAFFRHLVLRLCLWLEGALPMRLVRFMRAMEQTGIIERDGGTWRFRHQLLQDWFAAKD